MIGNVVGSIGGLIMLICHIIVIVKMFQNGQTGLGILAIVLTFCCGIGFLFTLIYGWVKAGEWNIQPVMLVFTVGVILNIAGGVMAPPDIEAIKKALGQ